MKKQISVLGLAMALVLGATAQAATLSIVENEDITNERIAQGGIQVEFVVNENPDRSWVEVTLIQEAPTDVDLPASYRTLQIKLQELQFNSQTKEIFINLSSGRVVCANVVKRGFLIRYDAIEMTHSCEFDIQTKYEKVLRDNGFKTWKENAYLLNIGLVVRE